MDVDAKLVLTGLVFCLLFGFATTVTIETDAPDWVTLPLFVLALLGVVLVFCGVLVASWSTI